MINQTAQIYRLSLVVLIMGLLSFLHIPTSYAEINSSPGLVIVSHDIALTGDISGYVRNDSRTSYGNVVIKIDLYDEKNVKIDRISGYAGASLLRPQRQTRFDVPIPEKYRGKFKTYKIFAVVGTSRYEPKFLSN
ncbi:MAG: FxLYD domain-containing protein [Negativicutes bacterium]|nr:FxLYD domain-containing protein [Negativicutes bacterium]